MVELLDYVVSSGLRQDDLFSAWLVKALLEVVMWGSKINREGTIFTKNPSGVGRTEYPLIQYGATHECR